MNTPRVPRTLELSPPQVTCIDKSPESDVRPQTVGTMLCSSAYILTDNYEQVCRNELWAPTARQPLLPDRDVIATNAWSKASNVSGRPSLEDEAEERILWPRGVSAYSCLFGERFITSDVSPLSKQAIMGSGELDTLSTGWASIRFPRARAIWIEQRLWY